jgi:16S rRNA processing protein RimM
LAVGASGDRFVVVGRIAGLFGVGGEVRVESYTDPREQLLELSPWYLERGAEWWPVAVLSGRTHGKALVGRLEGLSDRDLARGSIGADVAVRRDQLPPAPPGRYYWADLLGLSVVGLAGEKLGRVSSLMETGANDVLVVHGDRERLIPFVPGVVVRNVDLARGTIEVEWAAED